jgi:hypothetical protein
VFGRINNTQPWELFLKNFGVLNSIANHFQFIERVDIIFKLTKFWKHGFSMLELETYPFI